MTSTLHDTGSLLAAARELRPVLAERAADTELNRQVPQETIDALYQAGFFDLMVPRRWGGGGEGIKTQVQVAAEIAKGCPATGWVLTIVGFITAIAGSYLPDAGTKQIYGSGRRPLVCGVNGFTGTAKQTADGDYIISGRWGFASGSAHAEWFMGGVMIMDEDDQPVDLGWGFIPFSELSIKDTWHVAGMRGTGSNTVIADEVKVSADVFLRVGDRAAQETAPGPDAEILDRMPFAPLFSIGLMGPCLGAVEAAYDIVSENMHKRGVSYFEFDKQTSSGALLSQIGKARMQIDSAWLHVMRAAEALENDSATGQMSPAVRIRCRADASEAVVNMRSAMDILLDISGASSFAESNPLQRLWRDLSVGSRHAWIGSTLMYEAFARTQLGVEPNITMYV